MKNRIVLMIGLAGALFVPAAFAAGSSIEVVQSVPLETTLAVPGIPETQQVWLDMINSAHTSLDLEEFYVSDQAGQSLSPVLQAIQAAAARGVAVRLLVDSKFYAEYPDSVNQIGQTSGCESRAIDFSSLGGVQHSKYFIVDGQQAFVGSQNFDWRSLSHIHEVGLRVSDEKVTSDLQLIFDKDWAQGSTVGPSTARGFMTVFWPAWVRMTQIFSSSTTAASVYVTASPAQINPPGISDTLSTLTQLFGSATHSVRIQVMEYTTSVYGSSDKWKALDTAIRATAARGVQVQLMVDVSDLKSGKADLRALAKLKNIQVKSVTIPQFSGGPIPYARLIHSKYMIVDGSVGWVGSENWSESYFTDTRDVGLVVSAGQSASAATAVNQLNQIFDQVWEALMPLKSDYFPIRFNSV